MADVTAEHYEPAALRLHPAALDSSCRHEVRYQSLFDPGRCLAFPCDAAGRVDLDALSEKALCNYLFAKTLVGRDFSTPMVVPSAH